VRDQGVFFHNSIDVTTSDMISDSEVRRLEVPLSIFVKCSGVNTTGDKNALGKLRDGLFIEEKRKRNENLHNLQGKQRIELSFLLEGDVGYRQRCYP